MVRDKDKEKREAGTETRRYIMRNPVKGQRQGELQQQRQGTRTSRKSIKE
jgi:hypothetical protein